MAHGDDHGGYRCAPPALQIAPVIHGLQISNYADDVDPKQIKQETIANPDKIEVLRDVNGNPYATKYSKDMGYNIAQPPANSSQSRVIVNHANPGKSTQFPYGK